jgi:hypothetical protein
LEIGFESLINFLVNKLEPSHPSFFHSVLVALNIQSFGNGVFVSLELNRLSDALFLAKHFEIGI